MPQRKKPIIKTEAEEIRRMQVLATIGALLYPTWGYLLKIALNNIYDPWAPRLVISGMCLAFAVGPVISEWFRERRTQIAFAFATILIGHLYWLVLKNNFNFTYDAIFVIALVSILGAAPSMGALVAISFFVTVMIGVSPFFNSSSFTSILVLWLMAFTGISVMWVVKGDLSRTHYLLARAEERYRQVFSNVHEGLTVLDPKGAVTDFNPAALKILGLTPEEITGHASPDPRWKLTDKVGRDLAKDQHPAMIAQQTAKPAIGAIIGVHKPSGERRWIQISAIPVVLDPKSKKPHVISSFTDISDLHDANRKILEQQASLATSNRLSAMGEMAAGISHEINNPLSTIRLKMEELEFLLERLNQPEMIEKVNQTVRAVDRVAKIVRGLRNLSRDSSHDPMAMTDLNLILGEALEVCHQRFVHAGVTMKSEIPAGLSVRCQSGQIAQVILNLLHNAFDAVENSAEKVVQVTAKVDHDFVEIRVIDSGPGVPQEIRERIMNPFFTTKAPGRGTGLGLSLSRTIIAKHSGTLELDKNASATTFVIRIPKNPAVSNPAGSSHAA